MIYIQYIYRFTRHGVNLVNFSSQTGVTSWCWWQVASLWKPNVLLGPAGAHKWGTWRHVVLWGQLWSHEKRGFERPTRNLIKETRNFRINTGDLSINTGVFSTTSTHFCMKTGDFLTKHGRQSLEDDPANSVLYSAEHHISGVSGVYSLKFKLKHRPFFFAMYLQFRSWDGHWNAGWSWIHD